MASRTSTFAERYGLPVEKVAPAAAVAAAAAEPAAESAEDVDSLLMSATGRTKLLRVADELHSGELVQFFAMYMELKNSKSASERLQIAQKLIADFLLTNSPNEINLEHASRMSMERLRARLARGLDADFDLHLFDRVRDEVRTMVANNLMPVYATRQSN